VTDFQPLNALEKELEKAQAGRSLMPAFLRLFVGSDLVVPSGAEIMPDGSCFEPVLFDKDGTQMVACFTAAERIGDVSRLASYYLKVTGGEFLKLIPAGYGLVVNPGQPVGFDVEPGGLRNIVAEFVDGAA
jgi:hypothetical protein